MSLPPQILRIKRKRGDDPVDSLYVEDDDSVHDPRAKRRTTEHDFVFRRLISSDQRDVGDRPSRIQGNAIPRVIPTLPGQEDRQRRGHGNAIAAGLKPGVGESQAMEPRRFHLSRLSEVVTATSEASHMEMLNSIGKERTKRRRREQEPNIAVFEEHSRPKLKPHGSGETRNGSSVARVQGMEMELAPSPLPRKRPGASAAISKSASSASLRQLEREDAAQAAETRAALQRYAMEELGREQKEQSKSLRPPRVEANASEDRMEVEGDNQDNVDGGDDTDNEWTYDTYVRQTPTGTGRGGVNVANKQRGLKALVMSDSTQPGTGNGTGRVMLGRAATYGYLVLPPRPSSAPAPGFASGPGAGPEAGGPKWAQFWETYGDTGHGDLVLDDDEVGDSDTASEEADWDSEQDDENAENFYGADYPEDELDWDDERGGQAAGYARFRARGRGASDDEEDFDHGDDGYDDGYSDREEREDGEGVHSAWALKSRDRRRVWRLGGGSRLHGEPEQAVAPVHAEP